MINKNKVSVSLDKKILKEIKKYKTDRHKRSMSHAIEDLCVEGLAYINKKK